MIASAPIPWSAQHLDQPFDGDLVELIESVAGLNAQSVRGPAVGIRARTGGCDLAELDELRTSYALVKINVMRGTVHLLTARQYWNWRPALAATLKRNVAAYNPGLWERIDYDELLSWGTDFAGDHDGLTRGDLGAAAAQKFNAEEPGLGFALRMILPLVEVAPKSSWRKERTRYTLASSVMPGRPATVADGLRDLARSFATAFGSASVEDFAYWAGISKVDAKSQSEILAANAQPDTAGAPALAVLPEFDNLFFCRRANDSELYAAKTDPRFTPARMPGSVIAYGRVVGHWTATTKTGPALTRWDDQLDPAVELEWKRFVDWYERVPARG